MVRAIALVFMLIAGGVGYEVVTGNDIGVRAAGAQFGAFVGGLVQGASSPSFGGFGGALGG